MDEFNGKYCDTFVRGAGHLGEDFGNYLNGNIKMGDTPSLLYMMHGDLNDPIAESWGGSFVRFARSPQIIFDRPATARDTAQIYSIMEFRVKGPRMDIPADSVCMTMTINKQTWGGFYFRRRYLCRAARHLRARDDALCYRLGDPGFPEQHGEITVENVWPGRERDTDYLLGDNWFTDSSDEALFERNLHGFKTVSKMAYRCHDRLGRALGLAEKRVEAKR